MAKDILISGSGVENIITTLEKVISDLLLEDEIEEINSDILLLNDIIRFFKENS